MATTARRIPRPPETVRVPEPVLQAITNHDMAADAALEATRRAADAAAAATAAERDPRVGADEARALALEADRLDSARRAESRREAGAWEAYRSAILENRGEYVVALTADVTAKYGAVQAELDTLLGRLGDLAAAVRSVDAVASCDRTTLRFPGERTRGAASGAELDHAARLVEGQVHRWVRGRMNQALVKAGNGTPEVRDVMLSLLADADPDLVSATWDPEVARQAREGLGLTDVFLDAPGT